MQKTITRFSAAFAALLAVGFAAPCRAQAVHDKGSAPHGGTVAKTARYQFEVVFRSDGLSVYPSAPGRGPIDVARLTGTATFTVPGASRPSAYRLATQPAAAGKAAEALAVAVDLSKVQATGAEVSFEVSGLPDPAERVATFIVPFATGDRGSVAFNSATKSDQKAIAAQKVCPVSREELGSMGTPIKAARGGSTTFLCCAECEKKVLADPDKFLPAAITSSKATKADEKAVAAQKVCPVSGEELDSMGGPIKVSRGGRSVFLCCAACLKKVQADPDKYLGTAPGTGASGGPRGR
ncbi:MAG: hypothetical protein JWN86_526 [Planctomycetota bacterium]|nr:hypothetical protein [Planctomycetota bacterium]